MKKPLNNSEMSVRSKLKLNKKNPWDKIFQVCKKILGTNVQDGLNDRILLKLL